MSTSRSDLQRQLTALAAKTPAMVRNYPEDRFFVAFACEADSILEGSAPADHEWVLNEIDEILFAIGKQRTDIWPPDVLPPAI